MYKTDITDKEWWVYDILGNLGWIAYYVGLVLLIVKRTDLVKGTLFTVFVVLEVICAVGILVGIAELINERINKLDRVLPKIRLYRGFGSLTYSGLAAALISLVHLIIAYTVNVNSGIVTLWVMVIGAVFCFVFGRLLFVRYKVQKQ